MRCQNRDCRSTYWRRIGGFVVCIDCGTCQDFIFYTTTPMPYETKYHAPLRHKTGRGHKQCDVCSKTFTPNSNNQKRCSPECAKDHKRGYMREYMKVVRKWEFSIEDNHAKTEICDSGGRHS